MCRGLRDGWDVDAAAERILSLHVGAEALEVALESAHRLNERDPTVATARAEVALSHALASLRAEVPGR